MFLISDEEEPRNCFYNLGGCVIKEPVTTLATDFVLPIAYYYWFWVYAVLEAVVTSIMRARDLNGSSALAFLKTPCGCPSWSCSLIV